MKIMCINNSNRVVELEVGKIYEADPCESHCGRQFYALSDSRLSVTMCDCGVINKQPMYCQSRFIPLSDIDETELIKERELINA
jgi:hypothetical protein